MIKKVLEEIDNKFDKELNLYKKLEENSLEKRKALIANDINLLEKIDEAFLEEVIETEKIAAGHRELNKRISQGFGENSLTLSQILDKSREMEPELVEKIEKKRSVIRALLVKIDQENKINHELLNHAASMVDNTIQIIAKVLSPEVAGSTSYDNTRKIHQEPPRSLSSIVKEA